MKNSQKFADDSWRCKLHTIIFEADTKTGKFFDISLFILIIISVFIVMLDSVPSIRIKIGPFLTAIEWAVTILFTIEYILRIITVKKPIKYVLSFFGIIDLLAILPTYISLFLIGYKYLLVIRVLRLLRIFRVLKLVHFLGASKYLIISLRGSLYKIAVFLAAVLIMVIIFGSLMYIIEGSESGFTSIPRSIYWAIVTLTTVGYGDIAPVTVLGQTLASIIMIMGYSIIAVPTGIVTAEMTKKKLEVNTHVCQNCNENKHDDNAEFCKGCGHEL
ncbi:MAG: ion transporter [Bacteroidetes bacterium]|jgi:voltage-gated potassium channel|nr:ion transporter [Bacteroidota bacterium]MBT5527782.1 ion transporter [Cytophagia bacterium]MBT3422422.1 ion transporter [Bacteroidota bacterium]MBT3802360.1 ion transporter [Bacteroidota bacterium]MBT3935601.1 ion transporter [Bacteroidota bacterium]